jgi:DNA polymerase IV
MPSTAPTILHADMDAFYAAVEQRDRPELRGLPVIVGGASNRGVVLTASYEARVFGVHSAMPGVQARRLCPDGIFVRPRMARYAEAARQIRAVFEEFTPLVEPLSLDEAFLDVTASLRLFGTATDLARRLKARVGAVTALAVSVGIGPTKMIAKIASGICKPDGLLEVPADGVEVFLRPLPVAQLWGVGPRMRATLLRLGLETIGAIADSDPTWLERRLGTAGNALWRLAHGDDGRMVDPERQRKSVGEECTFERDLRDGPALRRTIVEHAEAVARRLRAEGCGARTVTLKIKLAQRIGPGKYPILTRRVTLSAPVNDGKSIAQAALQLWDAMKRGLTVRLVGVSASSIAVGESEQLPLFAAPEARRQAALNRATDALVRRFGSRAVVRASSLE